MTLKIGQELHGDGTTYRIESVLGQGSFGITYLATTKLMMEGKLGRIETIVKVAIKEFFMGDLNSRSQDGSNVEKTSSNIVGNYLKKFQREAENLSKMHHPNIVRVLEVFDEHNTTYYVMEYIDGESLDTYIKRKGRLPEEESLALIKDVCAALLYMHEHKMLHLDLKPKNIMRNKEGRLFLIDFGLSKQYNENGEPESSTALGLGTPGYAPIEQAHFISGSQFPVTLDVYALGATLYKMLTGKTPPDSSYILNEGLSMDPLKNAGVSDRLVKVIERSMAPLKKDRTPSVKEFLKDLDAMESVEAEDVAKEETIIDEQDTLKHLNIREKVVNRESDQDGKLLGPKKNRILIWGAGLVILFLCVGAIVFSLRSRDSIDSKESVEEAVFDEHDQSFTVNGVMFVMKPVVGGTFQMGATPEQGRDASNDERPIRTVTLDNFYIGQTEVTQELWQAVMGNNPSFVQDNTKLPVEKVSWQMGQEFIQRLNSLTGKDFRLPTEAEWEFASRGGNNSRGHKYSGSNTLSSVAWFCDNSDNMTHPVATKQPNELGLYDMSGNVWELCHDRFGLYPSQDENNPMGASKGVERVIRGGSIYDNSRSCRVASRYSINPAIQNYNIGIRLVLPFTPQAN